MDKSIPLIVGIGNPLMGDDGVGPYVLEGLREKHPEWDFLELQTPGYSILSYLQDKKKLILIDAADFGGKPGEVKRVKKEQVCSIKESSSLDLHGADILSVLEKSSSWGIHIEDVLIYCIQIESLIPCTPLSLSVQKAAKQVITSIEKDMESF